MTMHEKLTTHITSSRQRRRGFTLTEIAIVLGIVGLILGAIWVAAAAVYNNLRVSHANTELLQIAQGTRSLFSGSGSDSGGAAANITDNLVCAKAVPTDMVDTVNFPCGTGANSQLTGPWPKSFVTVYVPQQGDSFTVEFTNVPSGNCINLIMAAAGPSRDPGLFYAGLASTPGAAEGTGNAITETVTPTIAQAAAVDSQNVGGCGTGAPVTVHFGFSLK